MKQVSLIKNGQRVSAVSESKSILTDKGCSISSFLHSASNGVIIPRVCPEDFDGEDLNTKIKSANEFIKKFNGMKEFYFGRTEKYIISQSIELPSNTILRIENCTIVMADNVVDNLIRTSNIIPDKKNPIGHAENFDSMKRVENIRIIGKNATLLMEESASKYGKTSVGWRGDTICFAGVTNFEISGIKVKNNISWGINVCACEYGNIHDIEFDTNRQNGDGVDIGQSHDIYVSNIYGNTFDDTIAIHSFGSSRYDERPIEREVPIVPYDYELHNFAGDTYNVYVDNVRTAGSANVVSMLAGDHEVYNVCISNISDAYGDYEDKKVSLVKIYGGQYTGGYYQGIMHNCLLNRINASNASKCVVWLSGGVLKDSAINCIEQRSAITTLINDDSIPLSQYDFVISTIRKDA